MSEGGVEGVRERNERGGACSRCPVGTFLLIDLWVMTHTDVPNLISMKLGVRSKQCTFQFYWSSCACVGCNRVSHDSV